MVEYLLMYEQWCRTSYTSQYLASGLHLSATNNNVCSFHLRENGLITSRVMLPSSACFRTLLISIITYPRFFPPLHPILLPLSFHFFFETSTLLARRTNSFSLYAPKIYIFPALFFFCKLVEQWKKKKKKKTKEFSLPLTTTIQEFPLDQSSSSSKNHWFL